MNKKQHKKFLKSPEYQHLQMQLMEYETLRKKGFSSESAFLRSSRFIPEDLLFNPITHYSPELKETWNRLCKNDDDHPMWRPRALTGMITVERAKFSFPTLPQNSSSDLRNLRNDLLTEAQKNNWHDFNRLPGAAVHGNVNSPEVVSNTSWTLRGTVEEREIYGKEDELEHFSNDDACIAMEDDWMFFDVTFRYLKNNLWNLIAIAPRLIFVFFELLNKLVEFILTGKVKFEITEAITTFMPPIKAGSHEDLFFYPYERVNGVKVYDERYPRPPWHEDFRDDDVIAHLQTATETPVFDYFKPFTEHQDNFPITNKQFTRIEGFKNDDLDAAMSENRVFITDFKDFNDEVLAQFTGDDAAPKSGGKLFAAIGLFAIPKGSSQLKTIAIQPTQRPPESKKEWRRWKRGRGDKANPPSKIITPADDYWTWQMAKNAFMSMYAQSNVVDHLSGHVYLFPIPTAFYRHIPEMHPLSAIVLPHLTSLVFNNFVGIFAEVGASLASPTNGALDANGEWIYSDPRKGLLSGAISDLSGYGSKAFIDGVVRRAGDYHFVTHGQPTDIAQNHAFDKLGSYPQHDDNTKTYNAIVKWVRNYIGLYYKGDQDVVNDTELQAFCKDVDYAGVNGFPASLSSREELVDMVSHLIYWMSVNHALGSLLGFQALGAPGFYSDKVMDPKKRRREKDWLEACPRINVGIATFEFARIFLDLPTPWHRSLGKYPKGNFMHDPNVYPHLKSFQKEIIEIDTEIRDTNSRRRWAYDLRMPSTMTLSPWN